MNTRVPLSDIKVHFDRIRYTMEVPLEENTLQSTLRLEFSSFEELKQSYQTILQNASVIPSQPSDYFVRYSIYDKSNSLLKRTFMYSNSYDYVDELKSYPLFHYFIGGTKYYLFNDVEQHRKYTHCVNNANQFENILSILYCSEYIDIAKFGLHKKQDEFFADLPIEFLLEIAVFSTKTNECISHYVAHNDASQLFESYNVAVNINYKDGLKNTVKIVEHTYPYAITNRPLFFKVDASGNQYNFVNQNANNVSIANCTVEPIQRLFQNSSEVVSALSHIDAIRSVEFTWKHHSETYVPYVKAVSPRASATPKAATPNKPSLRINVSSPRSIVASPRANIQVITHKLSDSIHENYVDRIEEQLRGFMIPSEAVQVEVPEETKGSYVPEWVAFYHPKAIKTESGYIIIPRHNHVPSIRTVDRVLYDYQSPCKMAKPMYWNAQLNAWTSSDSNRDYIEFIFKNTIEIHGNAPVEQVKKTKTRRISNEQIETQSRDFQPRRSTRLASKSNV